MLHSVCMGRSAYLFLVMEQTFIVNFRRHALSGSDVCNLPTFGSGARGTDEKLTAKRPRFHASNLVAERQHGGGGGGLPPPSRRWIPFLAPSHAESKSMGLTGLGPDMTIGAEGAGKNILSLAAYRNACMFVTCYGDRMYGTSQRTCIKLTTDGQQNIEYSTTQTQHDDISLNIVACSTGAGSKAACSKVACSTPAHTKVGRSTVARSMIAGSAVACSKTNCSLNEHFSLSIHYTCLTPVHYHVSLACTPGIMIEFCLSPKRKARDIIIARSSKSERANKAQLLHPVWS